MRRSSFHLPLICLCAVLALPTGASEAPSAHSELNLDADPHLVAWWRFDETSGKQAFDSSRNGHTALLERGLSFETHSVEGRIGKSLGFNGEAECIRVPDFKGVTGTKPRTIAAWIKTTHDTGRIVAWGLDDGGKMWIFGFIRSRIGVSLRGGYLCMQEKIQDGEWHHVAVVVREAPLPNLQDNRPWESCITICRQWAWKPDDDMKSLKDCLQTLVLCAGGDGNLLFNVGPMPDGRIEPRQVGRLKEMGAWLAKNGESIDGTRGGPWKPTKAVASTRKGNEVFVHLLGAAANRVELPDLPRRVKAAALLGGGAVEFGQQDGKLTLVLDSATMNPIDNIVRLELDGSAMDLPAQAIPSENTSAAHPVRQIEFSEKQKSEERVPGDV